MRFYAPGVMAGITLARQAGASAARSNQLGMLAGLMGQSLMPAFVVQQVARNEQPVLAPAAPAPPPAAPVIVLADGKLVTRQGGTTGPVPGADIRKVPAVEPGVEYGAGAAVLERAGFGSKAQPVSNRPEPAGTVLGQDPLGGTFKPAGTKVTLYVSAGNPVTDTVGKASAGLVELVKALPALVKAVKEFLPELVKAVKEVTPEVVKTGLEVRADALKAAKEVEALAREGAGLPPAPPSAAAETAPPELS
jgi:hypothetical protein